MFPHLRVYALLHERLNLSGAASAWEPMP